MSTGKGIGGREVPGAAPVDERKGESLSRNQKKKKGKRGRKGAASATLGVENEAAAGSGREEAKPLLQEEVKGAGSAQESAGLGSRGGAEKQLGRVGEGYGEVGGLLEQDVGYAGGPQQNLGLDDDGGMENGLGEPQSLDTVAPSLLDKEEDLERQGVVQWLHNQTSPPYRNLSDDRRTKIVDHVVNYKYPHRDPGWKSSIRLMIWRAVVRANFWWINPDTGVHTGKPKTIRRPEGVYEANFEVFVMCAAERLDRIGRDLPDPEYVRKVENEVRQCLKKAEEEQMTEHLRHLAFLLMFDEDSRRDVLSLEQMQERIRRAFGDVGYDWEGNGIFKAGVEELAVQPNCNLEVADAIWHDAVSQL